jgi:Alpha/beta hydrolase
LEECHQVFARAGRDLGDLHEVLVLARRKVDELNDAHRVLSAAQVAFQGPFGATFGGREGPGYLLAEGVLRVARARSGFECVADIDTAYARVQGRVVEETGLCNQLLSRLTAQGCLPVGRTGFAGGVSKYDASFGLLAVWSGREVADLLAGHTSFPSDPKQVHDAWLALRPDQQAALLAGAPGRFGNLNGIPAADRNTANRARLAAQLKLLTTASEALNSPHPKRPEDLERLPMETLDDLERMTGMSQTEARQALLLDAQLGRGGDVGAARLLAYEPGSYGGKGRAAIAFGDVDRADNIAFCVPGLNSSLGNFNEVSGDALGLLE